MHISYGEFPISHHLIQKFIATEYAKWTFHTQFIGIRGYFSSRSIFNIAINIMAPRMQGFVAYPEVSLTGFLP